MNIVFEGINGSGKTTLINSLKDEFEKEKIKYTYISDLKYDTPLKPVLEMMVKDSVFAELKNEFKTSIFESLVFAANHHYIQEKLKNEKGIFLYDRDYISVLGYQKGIIQKEYIDWEKFYIAFREIMLFELKKIDLLVYLSVPMDENIRRIESRNNKKYSKEDIDLLLGLRNNVEEEVKKAQEQYNIPTLYLSGIEEPKENIKLIKTKITGFNI